MIDHVKQQLEKMRVQEQGLEQDLILLNEQLIMTRGAIQVLQNTLDTYEEGEQQPPSDGKAGTFARK